jgi:hypothetical protein
MNPLSPLLSSVWQSIEKYPDARWKDALSLGQLASKEWLIDVANETYKEKTFKTAFVIGGWYGLLPALWKQFPRCPIQNFRSIDKDEHCAPVAESINRKWVIDDWQFKAITTDALNIDYQNPKLQLKKQNGEIVLAFDKPDIIVNTSCEHFSHLSKWTSLLPGGTEVILQSNNYFQDPEHINCSTSIDSFINTLNLTTIRFSGELTLPEYTRYMVIGKI